MNCFGPSATAVTGSGRGPFVRTTVSSPLAGPVRVSLLGFVCRAILNSLLGLSCTTALAQNSLTLEWDPSPDLRVVDYIVYYGVRDGLSTLTARSTGKTKVTI